MNAELKVLLSVLLISSISFISQALALKIAPNVKEIDAFTGEPFTIVCADEGRVDQDQDLGLKWMSPVGEAVYTVESKDGHLPKSVPSNRWSKIMSSIIGDQMTKMTAMVTEDKKNSGIYRCVLVNKKTNQIIEQSPIKVNLFKSIELKKRPPPSTTLEQGRRLEISCEAQFDADLLGTKVVWLKNGVRLRQDGRVTIRETVPPRVMSLLAIDKVTSDDSGSYGCRARQTTGKASQTKLALTNVRVVERDEPFAFI